MRSNTMRFALASGALALACSVVTSCGEDETSGTPEGADGSAPRDGNTPATSDAGDVDAGGETDGSTADAGDAAPVCLESDASAPAILLAQGQVKPYAVAVDGTSVYWGTDDGSIKKCPLAGCPNGGEVLVAKGPASVYRESR